MVLGDTSGGWSPAPVALFLRGARRNQPGLLNGPPVTTSQLHKLTGPEGLMSDETATAAHPTVVKELLTKN